MEGERGLCIGNTGTRGGSEELGCTLRGYYNDDCFQRPASTNPARTAQTAKRRGITGTQQHAKPNGNHHSKSWLHLCCPGIQLFYPVNYEQMAKTVPSLVSMSSVFSINSGKIRLTKLTVEFQNLHCLGGDKQ